MSETALPKTPRALSIVRRFDVVPVILFGLFAAGPFLAAASGAEGYVLSLLTRVMILGLAALSLDLILGYGALVSFGHAAFLGIGAYAVGILSAHGSEDLFVQIPVALAASALVRASHRGALAAHEGRLFHHDHSWPSARCCSFSPHPSRPMAATTA